MTIQRRLEDDAPAGTRISDVGGEHGLVDALAIQMSLKLEKNRGKRHWLDDQVSDAYLIRRLMEEVGELVEAVFYAGDPWSEAADVSVFAAMLADRRILLSEGSDG